MIVFQPPKLSFKVKNFFGLYELSPFEEELLQTLDSNLSNEEKNILAHQMQRFNLVRRTIKHIDVPDAHGFTNFHTYRFGKNVTDKRQQKRFASDMEEELLATATVVFNSSKINIQFWLVQGVFFRIEYRSAQKTYYPTDDYSINDIVIWPNRH